jgi:two-component system sensor histidine kinase EvgS
VLSFISFLNVGAVCAQKASPEPVTLQLRWFHQFQFAGYYAAIEKGFYAEEGLQVSLREFEPGKDRIAPVLEGKAQYGVGDPALLRLRFQGKPVVVLAQIFQHSPSVLITLRESGILSPDELDGKKVMMPLDDIGSAPIQAMLLDALGNMDRITIVPYSYADVDFVTDKIDAMSTYLTNQPFKLKKKGVAVNIIDLGSYGIDFCGDNLFTTVKEIAEHPERVKKMIRTTIRAGPMPWRTKTRSSLILKKYNSNLDPDQLRYEAKVVDQMIMPDPVPIGEINPRRYERIAETYQRLGISQSSIVPEGFI